MAELHMMLESMVVLKASDLYINAGAPPTFKVNGELRTITDKPLEPKQIQELISTVLDEEQRQRFENQMELDISLQIRNGGRFRLNIYRQKGSLALVARHIKDIIPDFDELHLPNTLKDMIMAKQGLVLVVGGTGVGKSTTLASMIDYRNQHTQGHILTVEDPIEFVHYHKKSLVSQREIGVDTHSYEDALKYALREAPDLIVIGEIRDSDTAKQALRFAETGHLCVATLHAASASSAIDRLVNFFPTEAQRQIYQDLALHLFAIVAQRLAVGIHHARLPVLEVLFNNAYITTLIEKGDTQEIRQAMTKDASDRCQTFDDAVYQLVLDGKITKEEAHRLSDSEVDLSLRFRFNSQQSDASYFDNKTDWIDSDVDFTHYQYIAIEAKKVNTERQGDMETLLTNAIESVLRIKGYQIDNQMPQLRLAYAFDVQAVADRNATTLEEYGEHLGQVPGMEHGFAVQLVDVASSKVVWKVKATRPADRHLHNEEVLQEEVSNLLFSFPECETHRAAVKA